MDKPKITQKEPFVMSMKPGTYYWCACGKSKNQPFCDGSHQGTSFQPVEAIIDEPKEVAWCGCKQTKNPPFCDGTHESL